jgi:hypothetical protein
MNILYEIKILKFTCACFLMLPLIALADSNADALNPITSINKYHDFITLTYKQVKEGSQYVYTVTEDKIIGPDGAKVSCSTIGRFGSDLAGSEEGLLWDSLGNRIHQYTDNEGEEYTNIPFVKWTPEVVDFLKKSVDTCVQQSRENGPLQRGGSMIGNLLGSLIDSPQNRSNQNIAYFSVTMSPTKAKDVIDSIYAISKSTNETKARVEENRIQAETEKQKQEFDLKNHISQIRSGKIGIKNINDAIYFYSPKSLNAIIAQPLLRPDMRYYAGAVTLDQQVNSDVLRAKVMNILVPSMIPPIMPIGYVILKHVNESTIFNPESMRLEQNIRIVGKYIGNAKYITVSGEEKTCPVIQLMYIGN